MCAREHYCPRTIDPKVLDSLLSSTLHASTKPLLIVLAGPETLPGRDRPESHQPGIAAQPVFVASGSRYPGEEIPFASVTHALVVFLFPRRQIAGETASAGCTTPLVITPRGPRTRRRTLTCNHCRGVIKGPWSGAPPAKGTRTAGPRRLPSSTSSLNCGSIGGRVGL